MKKFQNTTQWRRMKNIITIFTDLKCGFKFSRLKTITRSKTIPKEKRKWRTIASKNSLIIPLSDTPIEFWKIVGKKYGETIRSRSCEEECEVQNRLMIFRGFRYGRLTGQAYKMT